MSKLQERKQNTCSCLNFRVHPRGCKTWSHTCLVLSSPAFHLCVWGWFSADHSFIFSGHCCFPPSSKFNPLTLICITSFFFFFLFGSGIFEERPTNYCQRCWRTQQGNRQCCCKSQGIPKNEYLCIFNFGRLTLVSEYSSSNYIWAICRKVRQKLLMG